MLVLRDGDGELKVLHGDWAVEKLTEFGTQDGDYHDGASSVLRYNRAALALTGLSYALKTPLSGDQIRPILGTAAKHGQAIAAGLHKPMVLALANTCLERGIVEREFWVEARMGARICTYFETLLNELDSAEKISQLSLELDNILNQFILIGVPEAQRLYEKLNSQKA